MSKYILILFFIMIGLTFFVMNGMSEAFSIELGL